MEWPPKSSPKLFKHSSSHATVSWVTSPLPGSSSVVRTGDCDADLLQVGGRGWGGKAPLSPSEKVCCLIFRKAQQNILVICVTQIRLGKRDI